MHLFSNVILIVLGIALGSVLSFSSTSPLLAQMGPGYSGGDALWHLPKFGEQGWFIHAHNGRVRACNMDKTSVIGNKPGPRCSKWE